MVLMCKCRHRSVMVALFTRSEKLLLGQGMFVNTAATQQARYHAASLSRGRSNFSSTIHRARFAQSTFFLNLLMYSHGVHTDRSDASAGIAAIVRQGAWAHIKVRRNWPYRTYLLGNIRVPATKTWIRYEKVRSLGGWRSGPGGSRLVCCGPLQRVICRGT
jgi:hypothetical protein